MKDRFKFRTWNIKNKTMDYDYSCCQDSYSLDGILMQ